MVLAKESFLQTEVSLMMVRYGPFLDVWGNVRYSNSLSAFALWVARELEAQHLRLPLTIKVSYDRQAEDVRLKFEIEES